MQQTNGASPKHHIKGFWAMVIILVVAFIAGGLVYWFQFQYSYDEDINALEVRLSARHREFSQPVETDKTVKSGTSTKSKLK
jgi:archaellum component FlaF (FlaF/FlaG flagellin family)